MWQGRTRTRCGLAAVGPVPMRMWQRRLALGPQNYYRARRLLDMCVLHGVKWTRSSPSSAMNERRMEEADVVWGHTGYENCWLDAQLCRIGTQRL